MKAGIQTTFERVDESILERRDSDPLRYERGGEERPIPSQIA